MRKTVVCSLYGDTFLPVFNLLYWLCISSVCLDTLCNTPWFASLYFRSWYMPNIQEWDTGATDTLPLSTIVFLHVWAPKSLCKSPRLIHIMPAMYSKCIELYLLRIELSAASRCMAPCIELYLLRIVLCMETVYVYMYDRMYLKCIDTCIILRAIYRHV